MSLPIGSLPYGKQFLSTVRSVSNFYTYVLCVGELSLAYTMSELGIHAIGLG